MEPADIIMTDHIKEGGAAFKALIFITQKLISQAKKIERSIGCLLFILTITSNVSGSPSPVSPETDIHYTGKYCDVCHSGVPEEGKGGAPLRYNGDYNYLCKCHGYTTKAYIHPVHVIPSEAKRKKIPPDFPLPDGRVECITCHDIYLQCSRDIEMKRINPRFLRGAPYISRTSLCYRCHDEKKYRRMNPHNQLTSDGRIIVEKCLYCHVEKPDELHSTYGDVRLVGDFAVVCYRCHMDKQRLHPINANHLRYPPQKIVDSMKESEKKFGIILPLDRQGRITCVTCHNPHDRGVIPPEKPSAQGAGEKHRLRLAGKGLPICIACHREKFRDQTSY